MDQTNAFRGRLDPKARRKIGHELRAMFQDFRDWELPPRLIELIAQLAAEDPRARP